MFSAAICTIVCAIKIRELRKCSTLLNRSNNPPLLQILEVEKTKIRFRWRQKTKSDEENEANGIENVDNNSIFLYEVIHLLFPIYNWDIILNSITLFIYTQLYKIMHAMIPSQL